MADVIAPQGKRSCLALTLGFEAERPWRSTAGMKEDFEPQAGGFFSGRKQRLNSNFGVRRSMFGVQSEKQGLDSSMTMRPILGPPPRLGGLSM